MFTMKIKVAGGELQKLSKEAISDHKSEGPRRGWLLSRGLSNIE